MAKHNKKWILEHYECENKMSLEDMDFSDVEIFDPCADCFREHCVGCKYSCPDEYDTWQEFENCLADSRG